MRKRIMPWNLLSEVERNNFEKWKLESSENQNFYEMILRLVCRNMEKKKNQKMFLLFLLIPVCLVVGGIFFSDIVGIYYQEVLIAMGMMLVVALLMGFREYIWGKSSGKYMLSDHKMEKYLSKDKNTILGNVYHIWKYRFNEFLRMDVRP